MARRSLLSRYSRLPGSSKRVRTPGGSIISDRAYNDLVNLQRLQAGNAVKSGRGLAVARIADSGHGLAVARKVTRETAPSITGRATIDISVSFLERIQADARNKSRVLKAVGKNKGDV
jgi:hypothetical protein